jgi:hypothetical protein
MSKIKLAGLGGILIGAVLFVWLTQNRAADKLAEADRLWRQQADQLARLTAENSRLSNALVQVRLSQARANDQLRELLRLRGEVNALREVTNQMAQLRANSGPAAAREATRSKAEEIKPRVELDLRPASEAAGVTIPRQSWAFAGYATPEAALQTVVWAMANGDAATYLASLTPAGLQYLEQQLDGKSETDLVTMLKDEVSDLKALRLDQRRDAGDGKVSFVLAAREQEDGGTRQRDEQVLVLKNVGGEWRVVAGPDE